MGPHALLLVGHFLSPPKALVDDKGHLLSSTLAHVLRSRAQVEMRFLTSEVRVKPKFLMRLILLAHFQGEWRCADRLKAPD